MVEEPSQWVGIIYVVTTLKETVNKMNLMLTVNINEFTRF